MSSRSLLSNKVIFLYHTFMLIYKDNFQVDYMLFDCHCHINVKNRQKVVDFWKRAFKLWAAIDQSIKLVPNFFCWLQPFHFSSSSVLITINLENRMYSLLNHSNWLLWAYMAFCWHNVQHSSESVQKNNLIFSSDNLTYLC